jgi:hypothetical protein
MDQILGLENIEVRQFSEGAGIGCKRDISSREAIIAVPLSNLISVGSIKKENGIAWQLMQEY